MKSFKQFIQESKNENFSIPKRREEIIKVGYNQSQRGGSEYLKFMKYIRQKRFAGGMIVVSERSFKDDKTKKQYKMKNFEVNRETPNRVTLLSTDNFKEFIDYIKTIKYIPTSCFPH